MKKLISLNTRKPDLLLIESAVNLGYKVVCFLTTTNQDLRKSITADLETLGVKEINDLPSIVEGYCSPDQYLYFLKSAIRNYLNKNRGDVMGFLPSAGTDGFLEIVSELNTEFNFPGVRPDAVKFFTNKHIYLQSLENTKYLVPKTFRTVRIEEEVKTCRGIEFPCIVKPSRGTNSLGVYICETPEDLIDFFSFNGRENQLSPIAEKLRRRTEIGIRNYRHWDHDGVYLIQEYITGSTVSVTGVLTPTGSMVDHVYDIYSSEAPYRAEIGFSYPSQHDTQNFREYVANLTYELNDRCHRMFGQDHPLYVCPFMADFVITEGGVPYLVDFALRVSTSGMDIATFSQRGLVYIDNLLKTIFECENPVHVDLDKLDPVEIWHHDIPKGVVKEIHLPDDIPGLSTRDCTVKPGDRMPEKRSDDLVGLRGRYVIIGPDAKENARLYAERFRVVME